jgi:glycosyltransferase involved in cell wall biosynthesis
MRLIGTSGDIFIVRLPEPLGLIAHRKARKVGIFIISLIVIDAGQLARAMCSGVLGRILSIIIDRWMRVCVKTSQAVVYVTQRWLQAKYPPAQDSQIFAQTDTDLSPEAFVVKARSKKVSSYTTVRLVSVGQMQSRVKGFDFLIDVVAELIRLGIDVKLDVVGTGPLKDAIIKHADERGVTNRIHLHGQVHDPAALRFILDSADVYVSGSRAEGLSRALIEAMARGLPAVCTRAGGTDELLDAEVLTDIDEVDAFAATIQRITEDATLYERLSRSNLLHARVLARSSSPYAFSEFLGALCCS